MSESFIPLCVPKVDGNEWEYVKECLDTEWLSYVGSYVGKFEEKLAKQVGAKYAIVTTSGTAALHLSLIVAGVGAEDEVVMPALTFVSPANAVRYCGAYPVFVDVEEDSWQWDISKVEDFLANGCERLPNGDLRNKITGRKVKALLPVHLLGGMADREALINLADKYQLALVEDSAEAMGATYGGFGIGHSFKVINESHLCCTSFNGNKIITTGGGGAVFTNDESLALQVKHLSTTAKIDPVEFDHDEVGYNYRMTNIAAAIGCAQLEKLGLYVEKKRSVADYYRNRIQSSSITYINGLSKSRSSCWLQTIKLNRCSRGLLKHLAERKIQSRPLWKLISDLPYMADAYTHSDEVSKDLVRCCLSIPCSVGIEAHELDRVSASIDRYLSQN